MSKVAFCWKCGAPVTEEDAFCRNCGAPVTAQQSQVAYAQPPYQQGQQGQQGQGQYVKQPMPKDKVAAGLLAILLGSLGIHKFYLGYNTAGLIMLLCTVFTLGLAACVFGIIGLVEGIIYLTKSDEEFLNTYVYNSKPWF